MTPLKVAGEATGFMTCKWHDIGSGERRVATVKVVVDAEDFGRRRAVTVTGTASGAAEPDPRANNTDEATTTVVLR